MFIPEIMTPAQYYTGRRGGCENEPLKRLMIALLADALTCYQFAETAEAEVRRQLSREAGWWLFDEKSQGPFSFESVCEVLAINPAQIRRQLRRWRMRGRAGASPRLIARRSLIGRRGKMRPVRRERAETLSGRPATPHSKDLIVGSRSPAVGN